MTLHVTRLRTEHLVDPVIDTTGPRLSWQVTSDRSGTRQVAYQLTATAADGALLWDTGRVDSEECVLVPWDGAALTSRQVVHWAVRVWDEEGTCSPYSAPGTFEVGLLEEWGARWIAAPAAPSAVRYLRPPSLHVDGPVLRARAYVTALGHHALRCNGQPVGDARLAPGWTDYATRLQYQVLDLTGLFHEGDNDLEILLADGWYAGRIGWLGGREHYGSSPQLLARLELDTAWGRTVLTTGEDWLAGNGPLVESDMLQGESWDFGRVPAAAAPVVLSEGTAARLVVSPAPPVGVTSEVIPVSVERAGDVLRVDLGQNLVGGLRLRLRGSGEVVVRHAELLSPDGSLYLDNLRSAAATDRYALAGGEVEVEPLFTFHGFRYAEIACTAEVLDITAIVIGSDLERAGGFTCSDPRVHRLHENIVWGARGNFVDVPTDCPQRDERMGWTGDAQVFAPTAAYVLDTAGFFTKWLRDLADTQDARGSFCDVAPRVLLGPDGSAGWADAGVLVPWVLWQQHGDRRLLAEHYPAMRRWVDHVHRANPGLLWLDARGYDNGDWLSHGADTDKDLIATAFFARSARTTALAAEVLGEDASQLHALADGITAAFQEAFVLPDGRLKSETQTAYSLALRFGLLPADLQARSVEHLAADVEARGHLTTGFLGVAHLLPALTDGGRTDLAYRLLLNDRLPSWLHAVDAGATTVWERWDGWTADRGPQDPGMNSFNHYALGAVGEWLYRTVAGIELTSPGGRTVRIAPAVDGPLTAVQAWHRTSYGEVVSSWRRERSAVSLDVQVPVGSTATVVLPDRVIEVGSGRYTFTSSVEETS